MSDIDHHELFKRPGISPTSINAFSESPSRFWKTSSYNPNREKKEATDAMIFGRLVHCLVLTPEVFEKEFAIQPEKTNQLDTVSEIKAALKSAGISAPSSANKPQLEGVVRANLQCVELWSDTIENFRASAGEREVIKKDMYNEAKKMQDAMFANPAVKSLLGNGMSEEPFCWFPDGPDGLMKKCRLDYCRNGLVIEYKTDLFPSMETFKKTIALRGYHRQTSFQMDAAELKYGKRPDGAIIIAQDKEFHDDIAIYALSAEALSIGAQENQKVFEKIKERMKRNDWRTFPQKIQEIDLPRWYKPANIIGE